MKTSKDICDTLLQLSRDQFWDDVVELFEDLETRLLAEEEFEGIALTGPSPVDVTHYESLPLVLASREPLLRVHQVPANQNTVLAATDLATGRVYLGQALVDEKAALWRVPSARPEREPVPDDAELDGATAMLSRINAQARLRLPWAQARLAIAVINYDWRSNIVEVELTGGPEPGPVEVPPVAPPLSCYLPGEGEEALPNYEKNGKSPRPDPAPAAFVIDPEAAQKGQLLVRGAFALVALERQIPAEPEVHQISDGSEATTAAVVPMTLAVLALDWETPRRFDWVVPVYSDFILKAGDRITGWFNIDALADQDPLDPGDYLAYLLIEGDVIGPVPFSLPAAGG